jgi:hypothetical protein
VFDENAPNGNPNRIGVGALSELDAHSGDTPIVIDLGSSDTRDRKQLFFEDFRHYTLRKGRCCRFRHSR